MGNPENGFIHNLALGDEQKEITFNLFEGLSSGYASLSLHGREDFVSFQAKMITLDDYLQEHRIDQVNFVKVDIEGAEMMFLKGAEKLHRQTAPPILLMEMALQQT